MAYKIEKGVPAPTTPGNTKYPFGEMEVGDSFVVSADDCRRLRSRASAFGEKHGKRVTCHKQSGGDIRVWRVA